MAKNASLPTTSYNAKSAENFVLGAGAVVYGFKYDTAKQTYDFKSFGATSGGSSLSLTTTLRQMDIDGLLSTPVGADMIEETEGTLELNLLEHTLENIKMALIGDVLTSKGNDDGFEAGTEYVKPTNLITTEHYIKDLAHISQLSNGDYLVVKFDYAICTEGLEMKPQDGEDNVMTMTFSARADANNLQDASLPVKIARIKKSSLEGVRA